MFCPSCRYEYRPEISKCPDCDIWLVSTLPIEPTPRSEQVETDDTDLSLIYSTFDYTELMLVAGMLEDAGIQRHINHLPSTGTVHRVLVSYSRLPYEICVRPNDVDKAAELLSAWEETRGSSPDSDSSDDTDASGQPRPSTDQP